MTIILVIATSERRDREVFGPKMAAANLANINKRLYYLKYPMMHASEQAGGPEYYGSVQRWGKY